MKYGLIKFLCAVAFSLVLVSCSGGRPLSIRTESSVNCVLDESTVRVSLADPSESFLTAQPIEWKVVVLADSNCQGPFYLTDTTGLKTPFIGGDSTSFSRTYDSAGLHEEHFIVSDLSGASLPVSTGYFSVTSEPAPTTGAFSCFVTVNKLSATALANQNNEPTPNPEFTFTFYTNEPSRLSKSPTFSGTLLTNPIPQGTIYSLSVAINKFGNQTIDFELVSPTDPTRITQCSSQVSVVAPPAAPTIQFASPRYLGKLDAGSEITSARITGQRRAVVGVSPSNEVWYTNTSNPNFQKVAQVPGAWVYGMVQWGDLNGDGLEDIFQQTSDNRFYVQLSSGGSFGSQIYLGKHGGTGLAGSAHYVEVNGDKKMDLVYQGTDNKFWLSLSQGTSLASPTLAAQHGGNFDSKHTAFYADTNGDKRADLIFLDSTTRHFWLGISNGSLFQAPIDAFFASNPWLFSTTLMPPVFGDFDGDGRDDMAFSQFDGTIWHHFLTYSADISFGSTQEVGTSVSASTFAADLNGNGRKDLVLVTTTGQVMYYSGTELKSMTNLSNYAGSFVEDVTGDGKSDLVYWTPDGEIWLLENK